MKSKLKPKTESDFPKHIKVYLHSDKESMIPYGEELELSEEALEEFKYALNEVAVPIKVWEDGSYEIMGISTT